MARALLLTLSVLLTLCTAVGVQAQYNAGANATAALGATVFNHLFEDIIPIVEKVGTSIVVGPLNGKHYSMGAFHLSELDIGSIDVAFAAPNLLSLTISDLNIQVPDTDFSVFTKIFDDKHIVNPDEFKISCHGHFSGGTSGASATVAVAVTTDADGKLAVDVKTPTLNLGNLNIHWDLDGLCKVAGWILDIFKKLLLKTVKDKVDQLLPSKIQGVLQTELAKALTKVPIKFAGQPVVVSDHFEITAMLIPPFMAAQAPIRPSLPATVTPHIFTNRDVSIGISTQSFNDLVSTAAHLGHFSFHHTFSGKVNTSLFALFIPQVYAKCPGCPFALNFEIQPDSPPTGQFGDQNLEFTFNNVIINFTAVPTSGGTEENLFSVYSNLSFGVVNFTVTPENRTVTLLDFQMMLNDFSMHLAHSDLGPIHVSGFATFVQDTVKGLLLPLFNKYFKGLPLNLEADGFGLVEWLVDLDQDAISLGANLLLPSETLPPAAGYSLSQTTCTDTGCSQGCQSTTLPTGKCLNLNGGGSAVATCNIGAGTVVLSVWENGACSGTPANSETITLDACHKDAQGGSLKDACVASSTIPKLVVSNTTLHLPRRRI